MQAATISIGDEIILGQIADTHGRWLSASLQAVGVTPVEHRVVGDDLPQLVDAIRRLATLYDVLILTGGLGPTDDDLTRQALAHVVTPGTALVEDIDAMARIERWRSKFGRRYPASNRRQAMRPATMACIDNPHGTAPGLIGEWENCIVAALPGPPHEMYPMFETAIAPRIDRSGDRVVQQAVLHSYGLGESNAAERLGELTDRHRHPLVGTTASNSVVTARIRAEGNASAITAAIDEDRARIREAWQPYLFSDQEPDLGAAVIDELMRHAKTITTAESCTGGWLGKMLVDRPGSSAAYIGGWVTYSNELKTKCLGVPADMIDEYGAVSSNVADAMARGALDAAGTDYALSITGVAGPDGGTEGKPVGTVYIALAGHSIEATVIRCFRFPGARSLVRRRSALSALQMLRFRLLGVPDDQPLLWDRANTVSTGSEVSSL
ncbi:MAG: competence/damage-inducible protein A [Planctomycetota bacterium]